MIPIFSPPKDDSAEAGLSGDLDELPEEEKQEQPVPVDDIEEGKD